MKKANNFQELLAAAAPASQPDIDSVASVGCSVGCSVLIRLSATGTDPRAIDLSILLLLLPPPLQLFGSSAESLFHPSTSFANLELLLLLLLGCCGDMSTVFVLFFVVIERESMNGQLIGFRVNISDYLQRELLTGLSVDFRQQRQQFVLFC